MNELANFEVLLSLYNIDILAVTETCKSEDILDAEIVPPG